MALNRNLSAATEVLFWVLLVAAVIATINMVIDKYVKMDSPELSYRYKEEYRKAHVIWRNGHEHWFVLEDEGWTSRKLNTHTETLLESITNYSTFYADKVDYRDSIIDDL